MKITKWKDKGRTNYFLNVSTKEALFLIRSLSSQIVKNDPNTDRVESFTEDGEYFSISVKNNYREMKGFQITEEDVKRFEYEKNLKEGEFGTWKDFKTGIEYKIGLFGAKEPQETKNAKGSKNSKRAKAQRT